MVALCFAAGCGNSTPISPTPDVAFSESDLVIGSGADATAGKLLTVNYTGWIYDPLRSDRKGPQFETSLGATPFQFNLGAGQVIPGWDQGIVGMKVGGTRRLIVPPSLAYGGTRNGSIPPYSTLLFEIELLDVQ
jgi:FKBP-type peptidyl-prolyl cis-trans isomerase